MTPSTSPPFFRIFFCTPIAGTMGKLSKVHGAGHWWGECKWRGGELMYPTDTPCQYLYRFALHGGLFSSSRLYMTHSLRATADDPRRRDAADLTYCFLTMTMMIFYACGVCICLLHHVRVQVLFNAATLTFVFAWPRVARHACVMWIAQTDSQDTVAPWLHTRTSEICENQHKRNLPHCIEHWTDIDYEVPRRDSRRWVRCSRF